MLYEIAVLLDPTKPQSLKGSSFENFVRRYLEAQDYRVTQNINFTGTEIDLLAVHRLKEEVLYVECKARKNLTSADVKLFLFTVQEREADFGYFISTTSFEHQVAGMIREYREQGKHSNTTFIEPEDLIQACIRQNLCKKYPDAPQDLHTAKLILAITYLGDYWVCLLQRESMLPEACLIVSATDGSSTASAEVQGMLKDRIAEIRDVPVQQYLVGSSGLRVASKPHIDSVSFVLESEHWYDYLPASSLHFVGRDKLRTQLLDYFEDVVNGVTARRVFYITGKSGWGKSSLVSDIRGRSRNQHYKNKYYVLAIDSRSAVTAMFPALAFAKLLNKVMDDGFLKRKDVKSPVQFASVNDIVDTPVVEEVNAALRRDKKAIVLIFDQFEDIFRKPGLFEVFHKLLSDINDLGGNIIIGFSWKTEITIPIENPAYSLWQRSVDISLPVSVTKFGSKEINGIIRQLEGSTHKLGAELKRRIIESSQALPWLTKKLCIHIYNQLKEGVSENQLLGSNLNIKVLFDSDLEKVNSQEKKALNLIATRADSGDFFDVAEVGDLVEDVIIDSLRDKRLIVRSGATYNIYWDIFRDYLLTQKVPALGESYIIRQSPKACFYVLKKFSNKNKFYSIDELASKEARLKRTSLVNVVIELRSLGLVQRNEANDTYRVNGAVDSQDYASFTAFMRDKLSRHSLFYELKRYNDAPVSQLDFTVMLQNLFRGYDFRANTWRSYAQSMTLWFHTVNSPVKANLEYLAKGQRRRSAILRKIQLGDTASLFVRGSLQEIERALIEAQNNPTILNKIARRDLYVLGIIDETYGLTKTGIKLAGSTTGALRRKALVQLVAQLPKFTEAHKIYKSNPTVSAKAFLKVLPQNYFTAAKQSSRILYSGKLLTWMRAME